MSKNKNKKQNQTNQNRVLVVDKKGKQLMPTHPARARELLREKKAKVVRRYPFTIKLTERIGGYTQPLELKFDPGSKTTGTAMVLHGKTQAKVVWAANLEHRGDEIVKAMQKRRNLRKARRSRNTRYRKARFSNRKRPKGWLPPSVKSRVDNIVNLVRKLLFFAPLTFIAVEQNKFDTQKMQNPEKSGQQYQHGTLHGCEAKQYLLAKWGYQCAYCDAQGIPLQVEHVVPKAKGGSNRISNLVIACQKCNQKKGVKSVEEFLAHKPDRLAQILDQLQKPLKDASVVNAIRHIIVERLKALGPPVLIGTGSQTHFHRISQGYEKDHWIDAACVGDFGLKVKIAKKFNVLIIKAKGRGSRQMRLVDKFGFPRAKPKMRQKLFFGFATGDLVKAVVDKPKLKSFGTHVGRVVVRETGSFALTVNKQSKNQKPRLINHVNHQYCQVIQRNDGYSYLNSKSSSTSSQQSTQSTQDNPQGLIWHHSSGLKKLIVFKDKDMQSLVDSEASPLRGDCLWLQSSMKSKKYFKARLKQIIEDKPKVYSAYGWKLAFRW